jgi:hypothetical protein
MGAPVRESDDDKPLKSEPPKEPSTEAPKETPKEAGVGASTRTTQAPEPPWKRKTQRGFFEGDVAAVELRSRLALAPDRIPEPTIRGSSVSKFAAVLRLTGVVLIAAAVAGVAGYLWGFRLSTKSTRLASAASESVMPALSTPATSLQVPPVESSPPTARTVATGLPPIDPPGVANDVRPGDPTQLPVPAVTGERTAALPFTSRPSENASEIAAKMKMGTDLMAHGDVAAARMMFQRAAEAGEAAAAFALAETYDPVVLRKLSLRGGIAPDLGLARAWYERARDLGSVAALERIGRLTQIPQ